MSGETSLIIKDLKEGLSVKEISLKYQKTEGNIRAIAKRHNIEFKRPKQTEEERRTKKSLADRNRYNSKERMGTGPMPELPVMAGKFGGLGRLNNAWALKEGPHRGKKNDVASQIKYGLKTRLIGK